MLLALATTARAGDIDTCIDASEAGQLARDKGQFRAAKQSFQACAREACPGEIRRDCAGWLDALGKRMPSIIVRVLDADGAEVLDASVTIDGVEIVKHGIAVELDPGDKALRVTAPGRAAVEQRARVVEGERARVIEVRVARAAPAASAVPAASTPPAPPARVPTASYALGGVALVAAGAYAYFGLRAKGEVDDMRATCAPACDAARVDAAKRDRDVATAMFVLSAASLGGALAFALGRDTSSSLRGPALAVGVTPTGAGAVLRSTF